MKKTLVALAVAALATSSASAFTVYEQDGSNVDFYGSVRLRLDKETTKSDETKTNGHSNLHNNGSRFGVKLKHNIADDFYALGRVEFRFNSADSIKTTDEFGDLYAHRAYVGFGSKNFGELTFGRQVTIGDDIAQAGFDNYYGTFDGTLTPAGKAVVRYDYKGVKGLQVGVDYRFAENRAKAKTATAAARQAYIDHQLALRSGDQEDIAKAEKALNAAVNNSESLKENEVSVGKLKSGYGIGAIYTFEPAEAQSLTFAAGYTRDNLVTGASHKHHRDAYQASTSYTIDALTLAADYAGSFSKNGAKKERLNGFRLGAKYEVTPAVAVYTTYGYGVKKEKSNNVNTEKTVYNKFMLGSEYQVHKNVFTYIEGGIGSEKETEYGADAGTSKTKERNIAVGLNVSW